jgi:predicted RNA-binding protein Jag
LLYAGIKDRVVAFVDNTAITLSELEEVYSKSLKATPGITREEVLDTMVNRVLLLREAKKIRLEAPSEDELLKEYIDLKIRIFIKIKEEEVLDFYQKHIEDFQGKEFETVREGIENYLAEAELNMLLKKHIDELRKKAYIKIQLNQE